MQCKHATVLCSFTTSQLVSVSRPWTELNPAGASGEITEWESKGEMGTCRRVETGDEYRWVALTEAQKDKKRIGVTEER